MVSRIGPEIGLIVVVDDCCPEGTGKVVEASCCDPRIVVIRHSVNQGVGGAFLTGMASAIDRGALIIVKVDADGQMDPALILPLSFMIENGQADYVKGNRFFFVSNAKPMPALRLVGNLFLSFLTKLSSGYWHIMDPTNGFFAIHAHVAAQLDSTRIAKRFFFESDLLFHLGLMRARVLDFPMQAVYRDEKSNLRISRILGPFLLGHFKNTGRRIFYRYFLRDFSVASVELASGLGLSVFGFSFGLYHWIESALLGTFASTGTIMVAALPMLIGFQLLLGFLHYDVGSVPRAPIHSFLKPVLHHPGKAQPAPSGVD